MAGMRRVKRLPRLAIQAEIRVKKNLLASEWVPVEVIDYSSLGMGIRPGEAMAESLQKQGAIQLNLRLETEVGEITADGVNATVHHLAEEEGASVVGLEFEKYTKASTRESLARIESIFNRHRQVSQRMAARTNQEA